MNLKTMKYNRRGVYLFIFLVSIVYAGWMFSSGLMGDDLWYSSVFEIRTEGDPIDSESAFALTLGRQVESLPDVWESVVNHYMHWNNGRLANAFMFLSNLVPEWIVDCFHTLFFVIMFMMICQLSGFKWRNNLLYVTLVLWLVWLLLPWGDYIVLSDFQMNYVWSSAINLIVVWGLIYSNKLKEYPLFFCIIASFAAMMHEAFTLAVISGMLFWLMQNLKSIRNEFKEWKTHIIVVFVYCLFALVPLLSPALYLRIGDNAREDLLLYYVFHNFVLKYYIVFIIIGLLCVIKYRCSGDVAWRFIKQNMPVFIMAIIEFVIAIYSLNYSRGLFFGIILLLVILLRGLNFVVDFNKWNGRISFILSILFGGAYLYWMVNVDLIQHSVYKELEELKAVTSKTLSNFVFVDITTEHDVPMCYFSDIMCVAEGYHATAWIGCLDAIDDKYESIKVDMAKKRPIIFPKSFEQIPFEKWDSVAGNTHLKGMWPNYCSKEKLNVKGMFVEFASPLDSRNKRGVHYVYSFPDIISDVLGLENNGEKRMFVTLKEEHRAVPKYLKQKGVFDCDSIWIYSFDRAGGSVRGRKVLSINK